MMILLRGLTNLHWNGSLKSIRQRKAESTQLLYQISNQKTLSVKRIVDILKIKYRTINWDQLTKICSQNLLMFINRYF